MRYLFVCLLLCACPEEKKPEPPKHEATAVAPQAPKPDAAVITQNVVPDPQPPSPAEVEFTGKVEVGKLKVARTVFVVSKTECKADSTELEVIEQSDVNTGDFFTEMFFPQGTVAYLCLIALDAKGQQVAHAAYAKNPVTFEGTGEVRFTDVVLKVAGVKARPAPKGL